MKFFGNILFRIFRQQHLLPLGYAFVMLAGFLLLLLPLTQASGQDLHPLDVFFVAVSAVSTTGLSPLDVGAQFNFLGQLILVILFQIGGIGYMSIASFVMLGGKKQLSDLQESLVREDFGLPESERPAEFVKTVVIFSVIIETIGAAVLALLFYQRGVENWLWSAIFHSVSAFCTAGFSIFSEGLMKFGNSEAVIGVISVLSLCGAIGFIVFADLYRVILGVGDKVCQTTRIILFFTFTTIGAGTLFLFVGEPSFQQFSPHERLLHSFFQSVTAITTVGFNTVDIGSLMKPGVFLLFLLMVIGASPSGTGGGLKSTTASALWAVMTSALMNRSQAVFRGKAIPEGRVRAAVGSAVFYVLVLSSGCILLTLSESALSLENVMFEAFSALGTVGVSRGITGDLSILGKWIIIALMFFGRVGPLSLGLAIFGGGEDDEQKPADAEDIVV